MCCPHRCWHVCRCTYTAYNMMVVTSNHPIQGQATQISRSIERTSRLQVKMIPKWGSWLQGHSPYFLLASPIILKISTVFKELDLVGTVLVEMFCTKRSDLPVIRSAYRLFDPFKLILSSGGSFLRESYQCIITTKY